MILFAPFERLGDGMVLALVPVQDLARVALWGDELRKVLLASPPPTPRTAAQP